MRIIPADQKSPQVQNRIVPLIAFSVAAQESLSPLTIKFLVMFLNFGLIFIIMAEESYREYMCGRVEGGCGFQVRTQTEMEAMEHARRHQKQSHGMKEMSPEMERSIKGNIRPVSESELHKEYKEYTCSDPNCDFSVSAKGEDEIIEHAHMHQDLAHGVKESLSETEEKIKGKIKSV